MNLFDKSLRLALLAGATLLIACPPGDKEETGEPSDADTDTDSDTDSDTDADTDTDPETGIAYLYYIGGFSTSAGEFTAGSFGLGLVGADVEDWICQSTGEMSYEGAAPAGCPDCEWSFDLSALANSTGTGDYCEQFGLGAGALDGGFDYSWGYSASYDYVYAGDTFVLQNNVHLFIDEWFVFATNYGGGYQVYGDSESLTFARQAFTSAGTEAYYYYFPY